VNIARGPAVLAEVVAVFALLSMARIRRRTDPGGDVAHAMRLDDRHGPHSSVFSRHMWQLHSDCCVFLPSVGLMGLRIAAPNSRG